jgi:hypothetical protein
MTIIEVQAFGDFDMLYTECIMVSGGKHEKEELIQEFCVISGLDSTDGKGLKYNMLREVTSDFIAFLSLKGFVKMETQKVYFSD